MDAATQREAFARFFSAQPRLVENTAAATAPLNLELEAVQVLVDSLIEKARGPAWNVLRTAYREVDLRATPKGACAGYSTAAWLTRSLVLRTEVQGECVHPVEDAATAWLEERRAQGEARKKEGEGMEGRWILVKA